MSTRTNGMLNPNPSNRPLADFLTEEEVCDLLGLSTSALRGLRIKHGLPFIAVNTTNRIYHEESIRKWLLDRLEIIEKE